MLAIVLQSRGRTLALVLGEGGVVERVECGDSCAQALRDRGVDCVIADTLTVSEDEFAFQQRLARHDSSRGAYGLLYADAVRSGLPHREARAVATERYKRLRDETVHDIIASDTAAAFGQW